MKRVDSPLPLKSLEKCHGFASYRVIWGARRASADTTRDSDSSSKGFFMVQIFSHEYFFKSL